MDVRFHPTVLPLAISLVGGCLPASENGADDSAMLRQQVDDLAEAVTTLQSELAAAQEQIDAQEVAVSDNASDLAGLAAFEAELVTAQQEIDVLEASVSEHSIASEGVLWGERLRPER